MFLLSASPPEFVGDWQICRRWRNLQAILPTLADLVDVGKNLSNFKRNKVTGSDYTPAAVTFVLVGDKHGNASFVLTRRPRNLRRHAGQWALPGGRVDSGESIADAARREVKEEIGLDLSPDSILGILDDFPTRSGFADQRIGKKFDV